MRALKPRKPVARPSMINKEKRKMIREAKPSPHMNLGLRIRKDHSPISDLRRCIKTVGLFVQLTDLSFVIASFSQPF